MSRAIFLLAFFFAALIALAKSLPTAPGSVPKEHEFNVQGTFPHQAWSPDFHSIGNDERKPIFDSLQRSPHAAKPTAWSFARPSAHIEKEPTGHALNCHIGPDHDGGYNESKDVVSPFGDACQSVKVRSTGQWHKSK
ncbi:hypothetical protein HDU97_006627 [Phlyctochytrium planicorne]|nr:hypothetical protein HDU97_006627 [Phlyctochytrium planicorne]